MGRGSEKLVSDRTVLVWGDEMLGANGRLKVGTYLMLLNHTPKLLFYVCCPIQTEKRQLCSVSDKKHREDNLLYGKWLRGGSPSFYSL